ncbi:MAG: hypothetical protein IJW03_00780, partial [Clostridia bacterium]|nr:hypothetical protein [Clostridia bacterium]
MPYIETKTNVTLTDAQKVTLKERLAEAITLIPGKTEEWLMLGFEDGMTMSFRGDISSPCAMVEVDIFGSASVSAYDAMTEAVCDILSEVAKISPDRIYVKYRECDRWG